MVVVCENTFVIIEWFSLCDPAVIWWQWI